MASAAKITAAEFKEILGRYPALIKEASDNEKPADLTLVQLDQYRYIDAPAAFSQQTGRILTVADLQKLMDWKIRHGKFRPFLPKLIASNNDETVAAATKNAYEFYASNPTEVSETIKMLAAPLKGVGPATASLLLAVHDPKNIIFFSDEAYRWLVNEGDKMPLGYTPAEYAELHKRAQAFTEKHRVSPQDLEKVAYVIIKESEPVREVAAKYVPTGNPRGRKPLSDAERESRKRVPNGLPRGRKPLSDAEKEARKKTPSGLPRGRPALTESEKAAKKAKSTAKSAPVKKTGATKGATRGRKPKAESGESTEVLKPAAARRGRPAAEAAAPGPKPKAKAATIGATKGRGRPTKAKAVADAAATPAKGGKRKAEDSAPTPRSSKKAKA